MAKRHIAFVAVFAVAALAFIGCDNAKETGRLIVTISSFNGGVPVQSDVVVDNGTDPAYVPEDLIPVTLTARAYNGLVTGNEHSQAVFDHYTVHWSRTDGGTALATRDELSDIYVSTDKDADATIRLTTWQDKTGPILSPLIGTSNQIAMRADITFYGHEVGNTKDVQFSVSVGVHFADEVNQ